MIFKYYMIIMKKEKAFVHIQFIHKNQESYGCKWPLIVFKTSLEIQLELLFSPALCC